jgi:pyrroline-5-carboxylate reductase
MEYNIFDITKGLFTFATTKKRTDMKIAIIGAGNMGGAIARGLAKTAKEANVTVSNPTAAKLERLKEEFPSIRTTASNCVAAKDADIIVLAVKPWLVEEIIKEIMPTARQILVSVAAGIETGELETMSGNKGMTIFRVIPNTAIAQMESTTIIASRNATAGQEEMMVSLFAGMGLTFVVPEKQMAAATAMTSCGIAYALKYIQAVTQAGIELGVKPGIGMKMVAQSMKGAAELILQNTTHPAVEIEKVCTPGGITIKGVNSLEADGFTAALINAVKITAK